MGVLHGHREVVVHRADRLGGDERGGHGQLAGEQLVGGAGRADDGRGVDPGAVEADLGERAG